MGFVVTGMDRVGAITKRPPIWAAVAAGLVWRGGPRGRDAALRGGVGYVLAAFLANVVLKPLVKRRRPKGSEQARVGPITSSFPSGHAATDLAFVFGASQAVPVLFLPLSAATLAGHWSLVRTRADHLTDVLAGGAIGIVVALAVGRLWPDGGGHESAPKSPPGVEKEDGRLATRVNGAEARLLLHIAPDRGGSDDRR